MSPESPLRVQPSPPGGRDLWRWGLALSFLVITAGYALWPLRHLVRTWNDYAFVYAAGRAWLHGFSPYDIERWRAEWVAVTPSFALASPTQPFSVSVAPTQPFFYPPHFALIAVPMALLPWPVAQRCWELINVVGYTGIILFSLRLLKNRRPEALADPALWALLALATLNAPVRYCFWACQMTIIPVFGVIGAFWAWSERRTAWLAVFAFIAALKPQIGFLPLAFLLLDGAVVGLLWAGAAALVVGGLAMAPTNLRLLPAQFANCLQAHYSISFNAPDNFFGISALWAKFAPSRQLALLGPLFAVAFAAWLTLSRRRPSSPRGTTLADPLWQASIALAASAALMPLHGYDLVLYTPLLLLAYDVRPVWLAAFIIAIVQVVGRSSVLNRIPVFPIAPYFTLAITLSTVAAARVQDRARALAAEPSASRVPDPAS